MGLSSWDGLPRDARDAPQGQRQTGPDLGRQQRNGLCQGLCRQTQQRKGQTVFPSGERMAGTREPSGVRQVIKRIDTHSFGYKIGASRSLPQSG